MVHLYVRSCFDPDQPSLYYFVIFHLSDWFQDGNTALHHHSAKENNSANILRLLDCGANVLAQNKVNLRKVVMIFCLFICVRKSVNQKKLLFRIQLTVYLIYVSKTKLVSAVYLPCFAPMSSVFDSWSRHLRAFGFWFKLPFAGFSSVTFFLLHLKGVQKWSKIWLEGPPGNQWLTPGYPL